MPSIPHIKVDQPITADLLNRIADRLEPWSKMTVAQGSYLNFMSGPFGKILALMLPREIPARLIGDSSPYAWTALTEEPDGAYADRTGGLLGGDAAYEINGVPNLDGKPVMLRWSSAGDWRFQWVGTGCVADADHVCLCECNTPIPKVYHVGDDVGTHTLTYEADGSETWLSPEFTIPDQDLYATSGPFPNDQCFLGGTGNARARYRLLLSCPTVETAKWTLRVEVLTVICRNGQFGDLVQKYAFGEDGLTADWREISGDATFDCDSIDLINFTLPTSISDIATPGGGGAVTVSL